MATLPPGLDRLLRLIDGYIGALGQLRMPSRAFLLLWAEAATAARMTKTARVTSLRVLVRDRCPLPLTVAAWVVGTFASTCCAQRRV